MQATQPNWHPTDDLIVFGTHDLADFQDVWLATNLYTVRTDGSELTPVTQNVDGDVRATYPTWTPDGEQIIFSYVMPVTRDDWGGRGFAFINPMAPGSAWSPGSTAGRATPTDPLIHDKAPSLMSQPSLQADSLGRGPSSGDDPAPTTS